MRLSFLLLLLLSLPTLAQSQLKTEVSALFYSRQRVNVQPYAGQSIAAFNGQIPELAKYYQVIAWTKLSEVFGRHAHLASAYTINLEQALPLTWKPR